jgi:hypothetical protein
MAKNSVADWSATPSDNTDIADIGIVGGSPASNFDDAMRQMMAQIAASSLGTLADSSDVLAAALKSSKAVITGVNIDNAAAGDHGLYEVATCTGTFPNVDRSYWWITTQKQFESSGNLLQLGYSYNPTGSNLEPTSYIRLKGQDGTLSAWRRHLTAADAGTTGLAVLAAADAATARTALGKPGHVISTTTIAAGASSVDITIPPGYSSFELGITGLFPSSAAVIFINYWADASLITTGYYGDITFSSASSTIARGTVSNVVGFQISSTIAATQVEGVSGQVLVYPGGGGNRPALVSSVFHWSSGGLPMSVNSSGQVITTSRIFSLRISPQTGTLGGGVVVLKGTPE